jgi:FkbM family methyltransferase
LYFYLAFFALDAVTLVPFYGEVAMSVFQGVKWYYELCGVHGLFAIASFRIFGRPREFAAVPPKTAFPVYLRIDTSDFCSYRDVLIFKTKSYEPDLAGFTPKVIVDVGAHIGMASILFALKYPSAKIIALEPERANFAMLLRNTAGYKTIRPIQAALWREDGEVTIGPSKAHVKGAFEIIENGCQKVPSVTMETLMRETGVDSIDLLKMDIEGAEKEVFDHRGWMSKVNLLAIELHDRLRPGCRQNVQAAAHGFSIQEKGEITFFFAEHFKEKSDYSTDALAPRVDSSRSPAA